jgi:hypothetical protein
MSKLDIINDEIARREDSNQSIIDGKQQLIDTIEQFNKLDEFYRDQEKDSRDTLECVYLEDRHFTGEWPIVYSFTDTEKHPFFGLTDPECNPYFPITKVQDKTFDGLAPLESPPTKTGAHQRQRTFAATEDVARTPALTELQNFPDITDEPLPANFPAAQADACTGEDNPPQVTQIACEADNGTWGPVPDPVWNGPDTAPALLRVALNAWRADLIIIRDDVCDDAAEVAFWQAIIDDIDIVLPAVATDAVFVRNDPNPDPATWGQTQAFTGATEAARARLETAADTGVLANIATRSAQLATDAATEESIFFGLIKLRLHQANGSYAKIKATKGLNDTQDALKADNDSALELLNLMKVKNS